MKACGAVNNRSRARRTSERTSERSQYTNKSGISVAERRVLADGRRARIKFHFQKFNNRLRRNNSASRFDFALCLVVVSAGSRGITSKFRDRKREGVHTIIPETNNDNAGGGGGRVRGIDDEVVSSKTNSTRNTIALYSPRFEPSALERPLIEISLRPRRDSDLFALKIGRSITSFNKKLSMLPSFLYFCRSVLPYF